VPDHEPIDLTVRRGEVLLAGSLWLPTATRPRAAVLMWPGSGPSDRDNDVFFPPIRAHLLADGVAVASFDKRGSGESTGDWCDADIVDQADDALAIVGHLLGLDEIGGVPLGLYGHSQGGWVVLDAAARDDRIRFVVASSGPGVTPGQQERFATLRGAQRDGRSESEIDELLAEFDAVVRALRAGAAPAHADRELAAYTFVPEDEREWEFMRRIVDYDPRPSLERIVCPILGLFGGDDRIVPVEESIAVYRAARRKKGDLTIHVFPGADHRCQVGDPPRLHGDYGALLLDWILRITVASPVEAVP
jgi:pimeloyl-ACP methyl ester carboxylesterase